jgi:uncharacterized membrane protein
MALIGILLLAFLVALMIRLIFCQQLKVILCGRIALVVLLLCMALLQFIYAGRIVQVVPPDVILPTAAVYGTGVLECLLAAGLCIGSLRRLTAWVLIAILLILLPIHIYAAFQLGEVAGHQVGLPYLAFSIPFQIFVILWTWFFAAHK